MPVQTLGIFDRVFNWVLDKIIDPIVDWFSDILRDIFTWIFENILMGFLMPVFETLWEYIGAELMNFFYSGIYSIYCGLLTVVDTLQYGFDVMIGLRDISYIDSSGAEQTGSLLEYIMYNEVIRNVLIAVTLSALALCFVFATYSVMRSTLDFDFENKRPVGRVLTAAGKAMLSFMMVPLIIMVGLQLVTIVLRQIADALTVGSGGNSSIGDNIMMISALEAGKRGTEFSLNSGTPWAKLMDGSYDYIDFAARINISEIDYLIGFASSIFCIIVMLMCLFNFIRRIYDIVLLYIASPYFASTIVLDDGQRFDRWRETFIAKTLVGFGSAIGMRLYLLLVPIIMSDEITFFVGADGTQSIGDQVMNLAGSYLMKLIFVLGGMYAVYKSSSLLTSIISTSVAQDEQLGNTMMMHGIMGAGQWAAGKLYGAVAGDKKDKEEKGKGNKFGTPSGGMAAAGAAGGLNGVPAMTAAAGGKSVGGKAIPAAPNKPLPPIPAKSGAAGGKTVGGKAIPPAPNKPLPPIPAKGGAAGGKSVGGRAIPAAPNKPLPPIPAKGGAAGGKSVGGRAIPPAPNKPLPPIPAKGGAAGGKTVGGRAIPAAPNKPLPPIPARMRSAAGARPPMPNAALRSTRPQTAPDAMRKNGSVTVPQPYATAAKGLGNNRSSAQQYGVFDAAKVKASDIRVGNQIFTVPEGHVAFPKLVPTNAAADRIEQMKQAGGGAFGSYYDALGSSIRGGSYEIPSAKAEGSQTYTALNHINGREYEIPSGYTIVPEIMKAEDARTAAAAYASGGAKDFYTAYSSDLHRSAGFAAPPPYAPRRPAPAQYAPRQAIPQQAVPAPQRRVPPSYAPPAPPTGQTASAPQRRVPPPYAPPAPPTGQTTSAPQRRVPPPYAPPAPPTGRGDRTSGSRQSNPKNPRNNG